MLNPYISFILTLPMINSYTEKLECLLQDVVGNAVKLFTLPTKSQREYNVRYVGDLF